MTQVLDTGRFHGCRAACSYMHAAATEVVCTSAGSSCWETPPSAVRRLSFAGLELESGPEVMYIERHQAKFTCVGCGADKEIARFARTAALGSLGRLLMSIDMRTGGVGEGALQCKSVL